MERIGKHVRRASKNLQTFRFFMKFEASDEDIKELECSLSFQLGTEWMPYKNILNIFQLASFNLSFVFEEIFDTKIEIIHKGQVLESQIVSIVTLISKPEQSLEFRIGNLIIRSEEIKDNNSAVLLRVNAFIKGGFLFWKPSYYLKMWRQVSSNDFSELYRSENKPGENCLWKQFTVPYNMLGSKSIKFTVHQSDKEVGTAVMSINELLTPGSEFSFDEKGKTKGKLRISWSELELNQNFIDYLRAGINIKVLIAVDYTSSNLPHTNPNSYHYISQSTTNPYESSIINVARVTDAYNKHKSIELYGFGGIPKGETQISHCFKLGNAKDTKEVLDLYRNSLNEVTLGRPTNLNDIINKAQELCRIEIDCMAYYIVLIITDGDIHDFPCTSTSIVYSCQYPISFIIIGIGNSDFRNMIRLDSDNEPLKDREGRIAERDIVQFVPFNQYRENPGLLASKVLEEVPDQICGYMKNKKGFR